MMQIEVVFLLLFGFCHSAPHEGLPLLNPGGIGGIFKGPGSQTIIQGPDGSAITSEVHSGSVIREDGLANQPIVVAEPEIEAAAPIHTEERIISSSAGAPVISSAAPVLAPPQTSYVSSGPVISSTGAPILASPTPQLLTGETYEYIDANVASQGYINANVAAPVITESVATAPIVEAKPIEIVEQDPHIIETEIIEAPDVEPDQSSDLKGPSGRIITKGSASIVSGPASTTITEPRKIIVAPVKINIETPVIAQATIPLVAHQPIVTASTVAPLQAVVPLSYSTTAAPVELGYSTTVSPLVELSSTVNVDSSRINLGVGDIRQSIPVIEYSSSNGVINGENLVSLGSVSTTEAPILSSTISTDRYAPSVGPAVPAAHLSPPAAPTSSDNIQKIARIQDTLDVDGRVDMGYPLYKKAIHQAYQLPHVLEQALSNFYGKNSGNPDKVIINDKMGDLSQNEVISYNNRQDYLAPPDLSQTRYLGPVLSRYGIDASEVSLEPVPYSQVRRLPDGGYILNNRYARNA